MEKSGLIVEGGGMKCAYSAGILDAFLDDNVTFDYCMGVSAGAANTASYLAGQRGRNLRFYIEHVKDPRYISIKNLIKTGSLFGLQYIYGTLTNSTGNDPLDYDGPVICEVLVPIDLSAFPKQVSYKRSDGQMESLPLEYMNPPLEQEEFERDMLIPLYEMK